MSEHAGREQPRNVASPEPALLREGLVEMERVEIAGDAAEERHVPVGERPPKGVGLPDLHLLKSFAQELLELGRGVGHLATPWKWLLCVAAVRSSG